MRYSIQYEQEHVVVKDENGRFLFTADNWKEALCELDTLEAA